MTPHNDDVLLTHLEYIREGIDQVNARLDAQNGRIRKVETGIVVLETRADEGKSSGRNWGGAAGALGGFLSGLFSGWIGK